MRLVFDTNVIVSAVLLPDSVPAHALNLGENTGLILYSEDTLQELLGVLERPKIQPYIEKEAIQELYARIRMNWHSVPIVQRVDDCRDPKDNKFLDLALNGNATGLITGDKDLFVLHPYRSIPVLTPSDFLHKIKKGGVLP